MELKLNVALLVGLAFVWAHLTASTTVSPLDADDPGTLELQRLEDEFALHRDDPQLGRTLAEAYIDLGRPGLAIAVLRAGDPALIEHPLVAHRLAQAYEASGRLLDALATANLASARCARSLGTVDAPSGTPVPRYTCNAHQHAVLSTHRVALSHMVDWGVTAPGTDPRAQTAYDLAMRRARIALY